MPAKFSTTRMHRIDRSVKLELMRADDDTEDMTDVLVRSIESLPFLFCAGCANRGLRTRIARRSRCILCHAASRTPREAA